MQKRLIALLSAVLVAFCAVFAVGCGADSPDEPRAAVEAVLARVWASSDACALIGDEAVSSMQKIGVSPDSFMGTFFDGASYEVGDVLVDGASATAHVVVRGRSMGDVEAALMDAYTAKALEDGGHSEESGLYLIAGSQLLDCVRSSAVKDRSCDVPLQKKDGAWRLTDEGSAALTSILLGL